MKWYLNHIILFDIIASIFTGGIIYFSSYYLTLPIELPNVSSLRVVNSTLVTVSATLIGFLLTIITVLVTFKKGFEDSSNVNDAPIITDESGVPQTTIFDKKVSKEEQFYGSNLHHRVAKVFVGAVYEVGAVLMCLIIMQFEVISVPKLIFTTAISICCVLIFLSTIRSIHIFKKFLNVHLK